MKERRIKACCVVCGEQLIERSMIPYISAVPGGVELCGPGSRNIATEKSRKIVGHHCGICGIDYYKLPTE